MTRPQCFAFCVLVVVVAVVVVAVVVVSVVALVSLAWIINCILKDIQEKYFSTLCFEGQLCVLNVLHFAVWRW